MRLDTLAARVMAGFAQSSHDSGHVLELRCGVDPVQVQGNPLLLELALRNLIDNALGHTPVGTQVAVVVARFAGVTRLAVCDSGATLVGPVPADDRPLDHLGLGLRLVERIANMHGARLVRDTGALPTTHCFAIEWSLDGFVKDTQG